MDLQIFLVLLQDGVTNGTIYALLAMAIVLLFSVTRIIFIPQGAFAAYAALTVGLQQRGQVPGTAWLLLVLAIAVALVDGLAGWRAQRHAPAGVLRWSALARQAVGTLAWPLCLVALSVGLSFIAAPLLVQALLALALVTSLGPLIYRLAFESLADASILVLLIVSVAVHYVLTGLALLFFGAEGYRNPAFWEADFALGPLSVTGQTLLIYGCTFALIALLWLFFERTLQGKALQAAAVNRLGARLMGISTRAAGKLAFTLAAFIGALAGLLLGPTTTMFYDSGFLIGLKGFIAAVFAALSSFPLALVGALGVGVLESFSSFWASAFKEVLVFAAILPVLLWRSLRHPPALES